ncbi:MAG TPA: SpoIIE family protein phosphatase [Candidatus Limnocylindria bacterium]|nr:SpoIIE family protein phosphatase [Candidatus Limnocylindria bacterium]
MSILTSVLGRFGRDQSPPNLAVPTTAELSPAPGAQVEIADHDPFLAYLQAASGPVDLEALELDSPAVRELRAAGVVLVVPLISSGELIGTLNLGPRLSEQGYSSDDRRLLDSLAAQAAPALRVAQLVRQQEAEARERQRIEQELQVAQLIQQHFLPTHLPQPAGWSIEAHYRPARAVGGDFYDVVERPDGRIAFAIGDVTDKGVPAAMVMAATRSLLRSAGTERLTPGQVLAQVNNLLHGDIPSRMFVTCLYGVLDPQTGQVLFANAGHNLPLLRTDDDAVEMRATGMPLGLMPGMAYQEVEGRIGPGQLLLLHSDGITEAHAPDREMFGTGRLMTTVSGEADGRGGVLGRVLAELERFTGIGWEQEDDITLLALRWEGEARIAAPAERSFVSRRGVEREALAWVAEMVDGRGLSKARIENLKTAVGEAVMNAVEHGNRGDESLAVLVEVTPAPGEVIVRITDHGGGRAIPITETPDIDAKLRGEQTTRGWGLFLIQNLVDAVRESSDDTTHTVELVLRTDGGDT